VAQILRLPSAATDAVVAPARSRWPATAVDDWGRDDHLISAVSPLVRLRWDVSVGGEQHLPEGTGALLVTNHRRFSLSPLFVAWALGRETGRPVRFAGRPDIGPLGATLRRLGGLLREPSEVEGALRHGELVVIATASTSHPRHAGIVDHEMVGAAVSAGVPVHPVASMSTPIARRARAEVGAAVRPRRQRRGPLAEVELAELTRRQLQKMLDQMGGTRTGLSAIDVWGEG
jgi:1-acyl-sn-glycerol-3-phosphate acyltransferase